MRRGAIRRNRAQAPEQVQAAIPPWRELVKLDTPAVMALADSLGIPYTDRTGTLSAINKAR